MTLRVKTILARGRAGLWGLVLMSLSAAVYAEGGSLERLVFIRHGEKPAASLGQLNCQGLNRALALPPVLVGKYGRPDFIFAPDPKAEASQGAGPQYDYVRPLATIEPTAIQLGLPVNTQFNTGHSEDLVAALAQPPYQQALVFIAWEHKLAEQMVKALLTRWGGDAGQVPTWKGSDYDSIYVVEVRREAGKTTVTFRHDQEGLDGQSELCPAQQQKPQSQ